LLLLTPSVFAGYQASSVSHCCSFHAAWLAAVVTACYQRFQRFSPYAVAGHVSSSLLASQLLFSRCCHTGFSLPPVLLLPLSVTPGFHFRGFQKGAIVSQLSLHAVRIATPSRFSVSLLLSLFLHSFFTFIIHSSFSFSSHFLCRLVITQFNNYRRYML